MAHREPVSTAQIPRHVRTSRNLWLSNNPTYFEQANHALSLPLAYDRLIRVYQSAAERQAEGQQQGWAKMLEGALVRGEAKRDQAVKDRQRDVAAEREQKEKDSRVAERASGTKGLKALPEELEDEDTGVSMKDLGSTLEGSDVDSTMPASMWDVPLGIVPAEELLEASPDPAIQPNGTSSDDQSSGAVADEAVVEGVGKGQASRRWHELLRKRFVAGDDEDIDYAEIDQHGEGMDKEWKESRRQDEWFEDESEHWSDDGTERGMKLEGETGVQDF